MQHLQKITVFLHHWRSFQKPFQRRKGVFCSFCCSQGFLENKVVCYATVSWEGALRDDTTNGCEAEDLGLWGLNDITLSCLFFYLVAFIPSVPLPYWPNRGLVVCSPNYSLASWIWPLWNVGSAQFAGKTSGTVALNLLDSRLFWIAKLWRISCSLITILNLVFFLG